MFLGHTLFCILVTFVKAPCVAFSGGMTFSPMSDVQGFCRRELWHSFLVGSMLPSLCRIQEIHFFHVMGNLLRLNSFRKSSAPNQKIQCRSIWWQQALSCQSLILLRDLRELAVWFRQPLMSFIWSLFMYVGNGSDVWGYLRGITQEVKRSK